MRIVDLTMTVDECDSTPFAREEAYFKLRPIVRWEDKGFVSNMVEMTVHAGTHIDSPHHFVREHPGVAELPVESMISDAVVLDLSFRGQANARITPDDLEQAERALNAQGHRLEPGGTVLLRTDWPKGHVTTDPKWWDESPCLTRQAAEWLVARQPAVLGYDFAQEEKGGDYEHADEILGSGMRCIAHPAAGRLPDREPDQPRPDPLEGEAHRAARQVALGVGARPRPGARRVAAEAGSWQAPAVFSVGKAPCPVAFGGHWHHRRAPAPRARPPARHRASSGPERSRATRR
jgi:kynurenine formamidase